MPSVRKNPPPKNTTVTIVRGCVAGKVGEVIQVTDVLANRLVGGNLAIRGDHATKLATKTEVPKPAAKKPGRPRKLSEE